MSLMSPALADEFFTTAPRGKPMKGGKGHLYLTELIVLMAEKTSNVLCHHSYIFFLKIIY